MRNYLLPACLIVLPLTAHSALIDNGSYTTDDVSGLDWYDLSFTTGISYNDVTSIYPGWRYATNTEVENLFAVSFNGYYDTDALTTGHHSSDSLDGSYANQNSDVDTFISMFGISWVDGNRDYAYGIYEDEDGILRTMGAFYDPAIPHSRILSTEFIGDYDWTRTQGIHEHGMYLVRASAVPIPQTVWLFGSGLIGLIGLARRKANA